MLSFSRTTGIRKDDGKIFPQTVISNSLLDILSDFEADVPEKSGAWGDDIGVKALFVDILFYLANIVVFVFILLQ